MALTGGALGGTEGLNRMMALKRQAHLTQAEADRWQANYKIQEAVNKRADEAAGRATVTHARVEDARSILDDPKTTLQQRQRAINQISTAPSLHMPMSPQAQLGAQMQLQQITSLLPRAVHPSVHAKNILDLVIKEKRAQNPFGMTDMPGLETDNQITTRMASIYARMTYPDLDESGAFARMGVDTEAFKRYANAPPASITDLTFNGVQTGGTADLVSRSTTGQQSLPAYLEGAEGLIAQLQNQFPQGVTADEAQGMARTVAEDGVMSEQEALTILNEAGMIRTSPESPTQTSPGRPVSGFFPRSPTPNAEQKASALRRIGLSPTREQSTVPFLPRTR